MTRWVCVGCLLVGSACAYAVQGILNSKHDLSAESPNAIRAIFEDQICIFCHATHHAQPQMPLWNRHMPTTHYRIYRSSTTDARIDQPGRASKMCLSCHDGSLELGLVRSRPATDPIPMTVHTMPPGPSNLTNDLSDDHPVSLRFDRMLSRQDGQLRDPQTVSRRVPLGRRLEVQCTTCHDPHNNSLGDFLRAPVRRGVLCTTCHVLDGWPQSAHSLSGRTVRSRVLRPAQRPAFASMADNACLACHQVHAAEGRQRLLRFQQNERNCLTCHDGSTAEDILSTLGLPSNHRGTFTRGRHGPTENPRTMPDHVECVDCHNPHAAREARTASATTSGALLPGPLSGVQGVNIAGRLVNEARFEYEVCLRCHGDNPVRIRRSPIERVKVGRNLRREISQTAASSHPFVVARSAAEAPSLMPHLAGKRIRCSDCHNSNNARLFGGSGPDGPHGSVFPFLLGLRYETRDFTIENAEAYSLCYRCHSRASILADQSFRFHRRHIVDRRSPCSACHDPHGVTGSRVSGSHLINFDRSIVRRAPGTTRIEFRDRGRFAGSCTLTCHGVNHINFIYSP